MPNLRQLPSVDKLLQHETMQSLIQQHSHARVVETIRAELAATREQVLAGQNLPARDTLLNAIMARLATTVKPSLQTVINATGVIIHTNLGRALLSQRAQLAMQQTAMGYSNLEYDLEAGQRGSRYVHAADLLCQLTGAEAAVVVNNNAAAVILALTVLAQGKEVVISRGQLVEIGGGFRIPDIMLQSGAKLVEVGTTNRTYLSDYERVTEFFRTGLLLAVHHSNYQITGFTTEPTLAELVTLSRKTGVAFMQDLGSGTLLDTAPFGLAHEPTMQESIAAGVDLVMASGDKLLGGPQAGLILGKANLIAELKKHPLIRALRVDKATLAALQATLLAYREDKAVSEIPVWQMIALKPALLAQRAAQWQQAIESDLKPQNAALELIESRSTVGGGSLPGQSLPTTALAIQSDSAERLAMLLRQGTPPIIGRVEHNRLLLDPRTVLPEQDAALIANCKAILSQN